MKLKNGTYHLLASAISDFKRNKVRTFLTSLGIMIGVMSVVMLIALGLGLKNYIQGQFEGLGANLILILPGSGFGGQGGFGAGLVGGAEFDERDVRDLRRIEELKYIVPVVFKSTAVKTEDEEEFGYIMGVNEDFFDLMNLESLSGERFGVSEIQKKSKVAVLGYNLAEKLFGDTGAAVGENVKIENIRYQVIGVAKKTGDRETDGAAVVPYTSTFGSLNPKKTFWAIYVGVMDETDVELGKMKIEETLLRRYDEEDFSVTEQAEILSTVNQIFEIINLVLVAIGSISLLVGGIGIMNIMYATVTERTKEVGIRRAIGATKKDVLSQFLVESVALSVIGGAMGLILASVIVLVVRIWFPVALNLLAVLIAFGVSSAIGVFFGVFPARRAANLPPIEAIRYE